MSCTTLNKQRDLSRSSSVSLRRVDRVLAPNLVQLLRSGRFQVRTPTDVSASTSTSSNSTCRVRRRGQRFNYEDGTFSPGEVQELVAAINKGSWKPLNPAGPTKLSLKPPPPDILNCPADCAGASGRCKEWCGAQTTVQRWYAPPLLDNAGKDRTISTVFTHDHFGPSTHQQAGLYAGLLVEPAGSTWRNSETGQVMGGRSDGGPTSWKADVIAGTNGADSFREFRARISDFNSLRRTGKSVNARPRHQLAAHSRPTARGRARCLSTTKRARPPSVNRSATSRAPRLEPITPRRPSTPPRTFPTTAIP